MQTFFNKTIPLLGIYPIDTGVYITQNPYTHVHCRTICNSTRQPARLRSCSEDRLPNGTPGSHSERTSRTHRRGCEAISKTYYGWGLGGEGVQKTQFFCVRREFQLDVYIPVFWKKSEEHFPHKGAERENESGYSPPRTTRFPDCDWIGAQPPPQPSFLGDHSFWGQHKDKSRSRGQTPRRQARPCQRIQGDLLLRASFARV